MPARRRPASSARRRWRAAARVEGDQRGAGQQRRSHSGGARGRWAEQRRAVLARRNRGAVRQLPPAAQYRCQRPRMTKMALVSVWPMVVMFACVPGAAVGSGPGRRLEDIPSSPAARRRRQHSGKRQVPDNDPDKRRADAATSPRRARAHWLWNLQRLVHGCGCASLGRLRAKQVEVFLQIGQTAGERGHHGGLLDRAVLVDGFGHVDHGRCRGGVAQLWKGFVDDGPDFLRQLHDGQHAL